MLLLVPFALLSLAALYLLFADLFKRSASLEKVLFALALLFCIFGAGTFLPFIKSPTEQLFYHSMFVSDAFGNFLSLAIMLLLASSILLSKDFLASHNFRHGEYYSLLFFSTLGMILLVFANNLMILFLGLEIMSIPLYILTGFLKDDLKSSEAAMKYFILGAFSTALLAMGIAFIYGATGTLDLSSIAMMNGYELDKTMLFAGFALILIGVGFKLAFVPFHMWVPDVYEGAPTALVAFMSVAVKIAAFAALARLFVFSLNYFSLDLIPVMKLLAILSMFLGNLAAIYQKNIKRMLAYSSIAHSGYILIAIISSKNELASEVGVSALVFYLVVYSMMKLGAFSVVSMLEGEDSKRNNIEDYKELGFRHPYIAFAMTVFMFSLAGIPLTAGFMGKLYVFGSAVKGGHLDLAIIGVINSLISVYYYLIIVVFMYMSENEKSLELKPKLATSIVIGSMAVFVLALGIYPNLLLSFTDFIANMIS